MNFFKKLFGKAKKKTDSLQATSKISLPDNISPEDLLLIKITLGYKELLLLDSTTDNDKSSKNKQQNVFNEIKEACEQCQSPEASNILGGIYIQGLGVKRDIEKGVRLLTEAAEQGSLTAMDNLGKFFNSDLGGNDLDTAITWWHKAAEKDFGPSIATISQIYKERGDYTQAMHWAKKGVAQDNADAEYLMGTFYTHGYGVDIDHDEAFKWYMRAAEKGHARAQSDVAVCYANGEGVQADEKQMVYWYKKAAEQNDPIAFRGLYLCYNNGTGVPRDGKKSA